MVKVTLCNGLIAIVDDQDFSLVSAIRWYASPSSLTTYAVGRCDPSHRGFVEMHALILGQRPGLVIDHRDGNGLNNFRRNLRYATASQNAMNRRQGYGASRFKGVCRAGQKWRAIIRFQGKCISLGYFASEEDAARAYNVAALEVFGCFAKVNQL